MECEGWDVMAMEVLGVGRRVKGGRGVGRGLFLRRRVEVVSSKVPRSTTVLPPHGLAWGVELPANRRPPPSGKWRVRPAQPMQQANCGQYGKSSVFTK